MFNKKSKTQKVIDYLEKNGSITSWEAITKFKYTRLSDIIFVLRKKGYIIDTETKGKENYAVYHFISLPIDYNYPKNI